MKELFLAISAAIEAVEGIRWVDFDLGQYEDQERQGVAHPAALIRFDSGTYFDLASEEQQGEMTITVRIAFDSYLRTHSKTDSDKRAKALEHLDMVELVHRALQGLAGENFGTLSRTAFATEQRADLRIYALTYVSLVTDDPAAVVPGAATDFQPWREVMDGDLNFCHDTEIE